MNDQKESHMTKIAYNACFGGFSLSKKAILHYAQLKGLNITVEYEGLFGPHYKLDDKYFSHRDIPRTDPLLIQVIEELGEEANGVCANLQIRDLPPGTKYRIDEYDGNESVVTQDEYDWQTA
jgi:hypothetical protein